MLIVFFLECGHETRKEAILIFKQNIGQYPAGLKNPEIIKVAV